MILNCTFALNVFGCFSYKVTKSFVDRVSQYENYELMNSLVKNTSFIQMDCLSCLSTHSNSAIMHKVLGKFRVA